MSISNLLLFLMLVLGPVISVSATSWPVCWAGMEIGILGLIPLLFIGNSPFSKESALKYFCIQALASALIFVGGMVLFTLLKSYFIYSLVFLMGVCLKLAIFPGHFWVTGVVYGLGWVSVCFILGPLKVPPLAFLSEFNSIFPESVSWVLLLSGVSAIVGASLGNNQTNIRAMLGASSIAHSGWMGAATVFGGLWLYLAIYLLVLVFLLLFLWQGDMFMGSMGVLSMEGLPPFIMFLAKLKVVQSALMAENAFIWLGLPLSGALLSLIFYLKFSYSLLLSSEQFPARFGALSFMVVNFLGVAWLLASF
uniref:NADH-ubiquinone oxidoreductase chain 2 n=1 Tax=Onchidella celtica TaxID=36933 RepID=B3DFD6_9EUPU|nr:NADH dehydrogenase subunit 2 [Onchidella celtica]ACE62823.1 NADH dehydrogenase subunit 2 [Onchidella celtica]